MNIARVESPDVVPAEPCSPTHPAPARAPIDDEILASRILIVDDHKLMRRMIGGFLNNSGFTNLCFAEDGAEAFTALEETPFPGNTCFCG